MLSSLAPVVVAAEPVSAVTMLVNVEVGSAVAVVVDWDWDMLVVVKMVEVVALGKGVRVEAEGRGWVELRLLWSLWSSLLLSGEGVEL